jgi:TRAP-type C4-dicarboxylate transport system substrate-binding protein
MKRTFLIASVISILALTGCTASADDDAAGGGEAGGGFDYGAPQEEVDEILAELEPVKLTFQPSAASENSIGAISPLMCKDYIEERSNGQIELEIIYGQAIAGYTEINDALVDGRLDIAVNVPAYSPSEMPVYNNLMAYSQFGTSSPIAAELATGAMMADLAWNNDDFIAEFEDQGLTVLSPMMSGGEYYMFCNDNNLGVTAEDWSGRSIRAGSTMNELFIQAIGASPVSLEYAETFEALQRGTVDCAFSQFASASHFGVPEVAPNISSMSESSVAGSVTNIHLAGSSWDDLPVAYQQILFDAEEYAWAGWQHNVIDTKAQGVAQANAVEGTIEILPSALQQAVAEAQIETVRENENEGSFGPEVVDRARDLANSWVAVAEELGYAELEGELHNMDEWYSPDEVDYMPFATQVFQEVMLPHRPR